MDFGNLVSHSSAFSKSSLNIWKFMVHVLLKPRLENFEHYFASIWWVRLCGSLSTLWHCVSLGLEWKLTFSSLVTHESSVNFDRYLSFTLSRLVSRNLGRWVWACTLKVYKVFVKTVGGPWLTLPWARWCNKLHSNICTVLLSKFVSRDAWLQH